MLSISTPVIAPLIGAKLNAALYALASEICVIALASTNKEPLEITRPVLPFSTNALTRLLILLLTIEADAARPIDADIAAAAP